MKKLSIVVLNYNTKDLLINCLTSLEAAHVEVDFETIVVDNASIDGSVDMVRQEFPRVIVIRNQKNLGFAKGNNKARQYVSGSYVLFLNSDTKVNKGTLKKSVEYLNRNPDIGALTVKTLLPDGSLDKDTRRSFPTPWVSLTHFSYLDRLLPKSKLFSKYWYGYKSSDEIHDVEVIQGAFTMVRKRVLDDVGWYDEDYFLDGEDIDLCWKIKEKGWKIIYYPEVSIEHIKGASKGKLPSFGRVTKEERAKFINAGVDSMEIFYKKRLWDGYPLVLNRAVLLGIRILKGLRYIKAYLS